MAALTAAVLGGLALAKTVQTFAHRGPKAPSVADLPPVPNAAVDSQVADIERARAESAQRSRASGNVGRRATILTGAAGVPTPAPVPRKTLLGQ